ncbi:DUF4160 domain-containing protein [Croceibacter atlanticus]|mgnify:CR=1 FL=1|jgi:hypothetical protein|uniref:DUF4160 domain-containing protein n=1 Tax=Croceibacter atlanticus (strain ATCC BAA-628 / JCM 21780 / CIP 108009 / IAM 15332 / KCTC 12090 / HTCC2559) TaxID=216432 RepID=A3U8K6_CROAH|nr:DUF4160 domain-containing protein [Croceibacter atlanticus]EAP88573.1 hypothetical protein CA2559_07420 [Croceibacter atlanticus HTCC2559]MBW4969297.1 DUF4160 domain-containing protein [Croceibacter atlanticus]
MATLVNILEDLLNQYWNTSGDNIELILENSNSNIKERVKTINNLEIIIYSNDHNPPHFHVKSKDLKINAKFLISNGELISGTMKRKDLKKIETFYSSPKTQFLLNKIWSKKDLNK